MSTRKKRKAPAADGTSVGTGTAVAGAAASAAAPTARGGFTGAPEDPNKILLRLRGRRRSVVRVQLPTVRAGDQHTLDGSDAGGATRARQDRKRGPPRDGVVLNISLFDDDFDLDVVDEDGVGGGGGSAAGAAPTADLLVPWDPAKASENHVVFEAYNAHVHLHSLFTTYRVKLPAPIVMVRANCWPQEEGE